MTRNGTACQTAFMETNAHYRHRIIPRERLAAVIFNVAREQGVYDYPPSPLAVAAAQNPAFQTDRQHALPARRW